MIRRTRPLSSSPAQALVEFALILTVLLMMIFIVIESARILWAWNQVQNAAREGARYAITGRAEPDCPVESLPKFMEPEPGRRVCTDPRLASIIGRAHRSLSGVPLNEQSVAFEDDNYYNIEVWGVNNDSILQYDFGGLPDQPVVVRVTYQVPIITPFFRVIRETIPVFGQVTLTNESFGQLGGSAGQGQGLPPNVPPVPTPGVTPSPTPSPTPTDTPTPGPTPTPSETPTATPTATPSCPVRFVGSAVAGTNYVFVSGIPGTTVTIVDLTTGATLGSMVLADRPDPNRPCDGFGDFAPPNSLNQALQAGHVLVAQSSDGTTDTTIVLPAPPTVTFTPTNTPFPTSTATNTPAPTATHTPSGSYITLSRRCANGPTISFDVIGVNWPNNEAVSLFWNTNQFQTTVAAGHNGFFDFTWTFNNVNNGTYTVRAISNSFVRDTVITVPCTDVTVTPAAATPTSTPAPANLVIGPPKIVSAQPVRAYTPVDFSVVISNVGGIDVNRQFFVDLFINPPEIFPEYIPVNYSKGYSAVSSLAAGASRTLTITINSAFPNNPDEHLVYGMVDSVFQIAEPFEDDNVSEPLSVDNVVKVNATPTPTATPVGGDQRISGVVQVLISDLVPQFRAVVTVFNGSTPVRTTLTDQNGFYEFTDIPAIQSGTYTVRACVTVNSQSYSGLRTGITPPNDFVNIYMLPGPCS